MRDKISVVIAILAIVATILFLAGYEGEQTRVYDCGMAEWHPDIPNDVKQECRRIRYEQWKKEQNERQDDPGVHEGRPTILRA